MKINRIHIVILSLLLTSVSSVTAIGLGVHFSNYQKDEISPEKIDSNSFEKSKKAKPNLIKKEKEQTIEIKKPPNPKPILEKQQPKKIENKQVDKNTNANANSLDKKILQFLNTNKPVTSKNEQKTKTEPAKTNNQNQTNINNNRVVNGQAKNNQITNNQVVTDKAKNNQITNNQTDVNLLDNKANEVKNNSNNQQLPSTNDVDNQESKNLVTPKNYIDQTSPQTNENKIIDETKTDSQKVNEVKNTSNDQQPPKTNDVDNQESKNLVTPKNYIDQTSPQTNENKIIDENKTDLQKANDKLENSEQNKQFIAENETLAYINSPELRSKKWEKIFKNEAKIDHELIEKNITSFTSTPSHFNNLNLNIPKYSLPVELKYDADKKYSRFDKNILTELDTTFVGAGARKTVEKGRTFFESTFNLPLNPINDENKNNVFQIFTRFFNFAWTNVGSQNLESDKPFTFVNNNSIIRYSHAFTWKNRVDRLMVIWDGDWNENNIPKFKKYLEELLSFYKEQTGIIFKFLTVFIQGKSANNIASLIRQIERAINIGNVIGFTALNTKEIIKNYFSDAWHRDQDDSKHYSIYDVLYLSKLLQLTDKDEVEDTTSSYGARIKFL
ncbi:HYPOTHETICAL PROTEIN MCJ_006110 [Mesomycoplasma conjunctivae]|uniref:Uncharacterized protein n=1 Tax=Mesomycoplasma conjunctivae (strain ATCC 25834 / NCTC 10147 / HRC/581) TaxID=572263 RepID=C5J743_MESCH|nr:hypothetical protein [Mesomycoplasma conjunctivae]CAT05306.1 HYPOTHETICAL PROTEIN MCJ_006110 [Mesomycoplasma conjunctivae]